MANAIIQSVCMSTRSLGYPKKRERELEGHISHYLRENGRQGVVDRMKGLQLLRTSFRSDTKTVSNYIALSKHGQEPHNRVEKSLWRLSDRKFFAITGAIIESVQEKDVSHEQRYDWWREASQAPLDSENYSVFSVFPEDPGYISNSDNTVLPGRLAQRVDDSISSHLSVQDLSDFRKDFRQTMILGSTTIWPRIADQLFDRMKRSTTVFSPQDVTKTAIPLEEGHVHHLKYHINSDGVRVVDHDDLIYSYRRSQETAPSYMLDVYRRNTRAFAYLAMLEDESPVISDGGDYTVDATTKQSAKYSYSIGEENTLDPVKRSVQHKGQNDPMTHSSVGSISFLPKPGLKARVVANPNRRVQSELMDLGESIQDVVYNDPTYKSHIYVDDQDKGRLVVSSELTQHNKLASVDLHAATDTIDFNRGLVLTGFHLWCGRHQSSIRRGKEFLFNSSHLWVKYQETMRARRIDMQETLDLLESTGLEATPENMREFNKHFHEEDLISDFVFSDKDRVNLQNHVSDIKRYLLYDKMRSFNRTRTADWSTSDDLPAMSYRRGQPLGTRPSFPLLTYINAAAASAAGASHYSVVGDDIVLEAEAYDKYEKIMSYCLGSKINSDKTMISDHFAEFVGYMFDDKGRIFPKKPRITSSKVQNAVKFGTTEHWLQELLDGGKAGMIVGLDSISSIPSPGKPMAHRVDTANASVKNKLTAHQVVKELSSHTPSGEDYSLPGETVAFHAAAVTQDTNQWPAPEEHLSKMQYNLAVKFFDHHNMKEDILRDSLATLLRRRKMTAELAQELNRTGTGIYTSPEKGSVGQYLIGEDGEGIVFVGEQARAFRISPSTLKTWRHNGLLISSSQQRFDRRSGLLRSSEPGQGLDFSSPNRNDRGYEKPDSSDLEL